MGSKILETIRYYTNPYRLYYRLLYYFPFGIRRINNLREVKVAKKKTVQCRLEVGDKEQKHQNFLYIKMEPGNWFALKWFYWRRKFAFQLPNCDLWFKAPRFTPWSYIPETKEIKFGVNYSLLKRLKESGVSIENIKFISWV